MPPPFNVPSVNAVFCAQSELNPELFAGINGPGLSNLLGYQQSYTAVTIRSESNSHFDLSLARLRMWRADLCTR